jgi:hypothetical protein
MLSQNIPQNHFMSCPKIYEPIKMRFVDTRVSYRQTELLCMCVSSACIRFAHTRLGGRRAMRDMSIPYAMIAETTSLS